MARWDRLAVQLRVNRLMADETFGWKDAYLTEWRDPHSGQWIPTPNMSLGILSDLKLDGSPLGPFALKKSQAKVLESLKANDLNGAQNEVQKVLTGLGNYEPSDPTVGDQFDKNLQALNTFMGVTDISQLQGASPEGDDDGFGQFDPEPKPAKGAFDPANGFDIAMDNLPGVTFSPEWAADESVQNLKTDDSLWVDVPVTTVNVANQPLIATEEAVKSKHVDPVVNGSTPLRSGYHPKLLLTDEGYVIIDGNTRVAMYKGLGSTDVQAQVIDARLNQTAWFDQNPSTPVTEAAKSKYAEALAAEKPLTAKMQILARQNGGTLQGLEFRVKQPPSLTSKIEIDIQKAQLIDEGFTPEQAAAEIKDSLRYTMQFDAASYTEKTQQVLDNLKASGYTNIRIKNPMAAPAGTVDYRDVKITATPPGSQITFELQFHTPESLAVKEQLHPIYEVYRKLPLDDPERQALSQQMINLSDSFPIPPGVANISVGR